MKIDLSDHFLFEEKTNSLIHQTTIGKLEVSVECKNLLLDDNKELIGQLKNDVKALTKKGKSVTK